MDKIRFGITGNAFIAFGGGKVLIEGGGNKEMNVGVIALSEVKDKSSTDDRYDTQVQMVFPNLKSINILRDALNGLEDMFKSGEIKEQYEKSEE